LNSLTYVGIVHWLHICNSHKALYAYYCITVSIVLLNQLPCTNCCNFSDTLISNNYFAKVQPPSLVILKAAQDC